MPFLHSILQEQVQLDTQEAVKYAASCGLSVQADSYTCLIVFCKEQVSDAETLLRYGQDMPVFCRDFFRKSKVRAHTEADGLLTLVLLLGQFSRQRIEKLMISLQNDLDHHGFPRAMIAVGHSVAELADVRQSFLAAQNAMRYNRLFGDTKVMFNEDLALTYQQITLEKSRGFDEILSAFTAGDMDGMRACLEQKAESIRTMTHTVPDAPYPTSIRRTMVEIAMLLMHIASDAGVDVEKELDRTDPYQTIFGLKSTPEIIDWVMELADYLNAAITARLSHRENEAIRLVKEYIQQHMDDPCLSLDMASTYIGLSASYFSAFFIRETGIGFREYVNSQRIDKAKELLALSGCTGAEIARRCGFRSESYFISVFKKYVQMTPGMYKASKK